MRKFVVLFLFFFLSSQIYAFNPEKYVSDELVRISEANELIFYYEWGVNEYAEKIEKTEKTLTPCMFILYAAFEGFRGVYDSYKNLFGEPRNVTEAKQLALYMWEATEYIAIAKGFAIRERRY
ncbi:MAG: hypothetical protein IJP62_05920 [Treponema sp.]|nr:hypothetical protein [Treponema sp.]